MTLFRKNHAINCTKIPMPPTKLNLHQRMSVDESHIFWSLLGRSNSRKWLTTEELRELKSAFDVTDPGMSLSKLELAELVREEESRSSTLPHLVFRVTAFASISCNAVTAFSQIFLSLKLLRSLELAAIGGVIAPFLSSRYSRNVFCIVKKTVIRLIPASPMAPPTSNKRNSPTNECTTGFQNKAKFPTSSRMRNSVGPNFQNDKRNSPSAWVARYD